jgi:hypothetical protein
MKLNAAITSALADPDIVRAVGRNSDTHVGELGVVLRMNSLAGGGSYARKA